MTDYRKEYSPVVTSLNTYKIFLIGEQLRSVSLRGKGWWEGSALCGHVSVKCVSLLISQYTQDLPHRSSAQTVPVMGPG